MKRQGLLAKMKIKLPKISLKHIFIFIVLMFGCAQMLLLRKVFTLVDKHGSDTSNCCSSVSAPGPTEKCVRCYGRLQRMKLLEGLWRGVHYGGGEKVDALKLNIHLVVSHCKKDVSWLDEFTTGFVISSVHIISKCGVPVEGAPSGSTIEILPNVGRCDHTYLHYITSILSEKVEKGTEKNSVVVFLKDNRYMHQSGHWNDFGTMVGMAGSHQGFSCGLIPYMIMSKDDKLLLISSYHDTTKLFTFTMDEYVEPETGFYEGDGTQFKAKFANVGEFYRSLNVGEILDTVQVCYAGVFAASVTNIMHVDMSVWNQLEALLSRGNSIEEGHFMERSWANLLSSPLKTLEIEALREFADFATPNDGFMNGALVQYVVE